jgi:hypothetical protein
MPVRSWDGCLPHRGGSGVLSVSPSACDACSSSSIGSGGTVAEAGYRRPPAAAQQAASQKGSEWSQAGAGWYDMARKSRARRDKKERKNPSEPPEKRLLGLGSGARGVGQRLGKVRGLSARGRSGADGNLALSRAGGARLPRYRHCSL